MHARMARQEQHLVSHSTQPLLLPLPHLPLHHPLHPSTTLSPVFPAREVVP